jgi:hypothetical protein
MKQPEWGKTMALKSKRSAGQNPDDLYITLGQEEIVIEQRYEVISIVNDFMIGTWFLIGSVLFFRAQTTEAGTWFFVIGSAQLLIRPAIRLVRHIHLKRTTPSYSQW